MLLLSLLYYTHKNVFNDKEATFTNPFPPTGIILERPLPTMSDHWRSCIFSRLQARCTLYVHVCTCSTYMCTYVRTIQYKCTVHTQFTTPVNAVMFYSHLNFHDNNRASQMPSKSRCIHRTSSPGNWWHLQLFP